MNARASVGAGAVTALRLGWLVLVWVLAWGTVGWGEVLGGLAVALVVTAVFPLPRVGGHGRLRVLGVLRLVFDALRELVATSVQVAWLSVRPGRAPRSSVIAVELGDAGEATVATATHLLSLAPGSVVVDLDAGRGVLYVHVLGVAGDAAVAAFRGRVRRLEGILAAAGIEAVAPVDPPTSGAAPERSA